MNSIPRHAETQLPLLDLGPTPTMTGTTTAITGVMCGVTLGLRHLNDEFKTECRSPFVLLFGGVETYRYVLTARAPNYVPLKKPVSLKALQPGYAHKQQGSSYIPGLGLTDSAYTALHGHFMAWTSRSTKTTGPSHPLFTGPLDRSYHLYYPKNHRHQYPLTGERENPRE